MSHKYRLSQVHFKQLKKYNFRKLNYFDNNPQACWLLNQLYRNSSSKGTAAAWQFNIRDPRTVKIHLILPHFTAGGENYWVFPLSTVSRGSQTLVKCREYFLHKSRTLGKKDYSLLNTLLAVFDYPKQRDRFDIAPFSCKLGHLRGQYWVDGVWVHCFGRHH